MRRGARVVLSIGAVAVVALVLTWSSVSDVGAPLKATIFVGMVSGNMAITWLLSKWLPWHHGVSTADRGR